MAMTESTMLELGTHAPDFELQDVVSGKIYSLRSFEGRKGLLVMFICRHCPYIQHIKRELTQLGHDYADRDVGIVAISSNDAGTHPSDSPAKLAAMAMEEKFEFPLLYDETQETAKSYTAACTPDFFLFDDERKLVYRGQLDDSRPGNGIPVSGSDLRAAVEAVLEGRGPLEPQWPSIGCNIKWRTGNEPAYFG